MNEFADRIKEYGTVDKAPQMEGRSMIMFISPRASD
jgi:translation initiation factor IF-3